MKEVLRRIVARRVPVERPEIREGDAVVHISAFEWLGSGDTVTFSLPEKMQDNDGRPIARVRITGIAIDRVEYGPR